MDFVHNAAANGQTFRFFVVVDQYSHPSVRLAVDTSMPTRRVIQEREIAMEERGKPSLYTPAAHRSNHLQPVCLDIPYRRHTSAIFRSSRAALSWHQLRGLREPNATHLSMRSDIV